MNLFSLSSFYSIMLTYKGLPSSLAYYSFSITGFKQFLYSFAFGLSIPIKISLHPRCLGEYDIIGILLKNSSALISTPKGSSPIPLILPPFLKYPLCCALVLSKSRLSDFFTKGEVPMIGSVRFLRVKVFRDYGPPSTTLDLKSLRVGDSSCFQKAKPSFCLILLGESGEIDKDGYQETEREC